ncbi:hypothetical protein BOW53_16705 [Solemya pervernicosa gill symbiont]|uniref:Uncharacterized protein n=2 Tax=Gammaproteobacteria incertae sedis TaxID=118884 RepID=A0A1T2KZ48_9GAMM|nr:hypothetical protein [Candidatus Reidiella endopervernicosa]OOZ38040.1 hypothetical protein BOW53_16705 [Solemya pervernicosa gill symbiont]QKQ26678.1 hypothetical protein HUE57_10600 [Candidatus Reidiella endopervernicosa]
MKKSIGFSVLSALIAMCAYLVLDAIQRHIDKQSGEIVERVLSDNTISQLKLVSEVQSQLAAGDLAAASKQLNEAADTYIYILKNNCKLEKCKQALKHHQPNN